jgi:hypothetical protein
MVQVVNFSYFKNQTREKLKKKKTQIHQSIKTMQHASLDYTNLFI